jgi:2'-5' RNA ligase
MIIFAVTTNFEFRRKPEWLDAFSNKHNKSKYDYHITLKQPSIIDEGQVLDIQKIISEYVSKNHPKQISIDFNKLNIDASEASLADDDGCIMIGADSSEINQLQKEIVWALSGYNNYLFAQTKSYEENFKPHITVASELNKAELELAQKDLGRDILCKGDVTQIRLTVIRNFDQDQSNKDVEITTYHLV